MDIRLLTLAYAVKTNFPMTVLSGRADNESKHWQNHARRASKLRFWLQQILNQAWFGCARTSVAGANTPVDGHSFFSALPPTLLPCLPCGVISLVAFTLACCWFVLRLVVILWFIPVVLAKNSNMLFISFPTHTFLLSLWYAFHIFFRFVYFNFENFCVVAAATCGWFDDLLLPGWCACA